MFRNPLQQLADLAGGALAAAGQFGPGRVIDAIGALNDLQAGARAYGRPITQGWHERANQINQQTGGPIGALGQTQEDIATAIERNTGLGSMLAGAPSFLGALKDEIARAAATPGQNPVQAGWNNAVYNARQLDSQQARSGQEEYPGQFAVQSLAGGLLTPLPPVGKLAGLAETGLAQGARLAGARGAAPVAGGLAKLAGLAGKAEKPLEHAVGGAFIGDIGSNLVGAQGEDRDRGLTAASTLAALAGRKGRAATAIGGALLGAMGGGTAGAVTAANTAKDEQQAHQLGNLGTLLGGVAGGVAGALGGRRGLTRSFESENRRQVMQEQAVFQVVQDAGLDVNDPTVRQRLTAIMGAPRSTWADSVQNLLDEFRSNGLPGQAAAPAAAPTPAPVAPTPAPASTAAVQPGSSPAANPTPAVNPIIGAPAAGPGTTTPNAALPPGAGPIPNQSAGLFAPGDAANPPTGAALRAAMEANRPGAVTRPPDVNGQVLGTTPAFSAPSSGTVGKAGPAPAQPRPQQMALGQVPPEELLSRAQALVGPDGALPPVSQLQREFGLGYGQASKLRTQLEATPAEPAPVGPRKVFGREVKPIAAMTLEELDQAEANARRAIGYALSEGGASAKTADTGRYRAAADRLNQIEQRRAALVAGGTEAVPAPEVAAGAGEAPVETAAPAPEAGPTVPQWFSDLAPGVDPYDPANRPGPRSTVMIDGDAQHLLRSLDSVDRWDVRPRIADAIKGAPADAMFRFMYGERNRADVQQMLAEVRSVGQEVAAGTLSRDAAMRRLSPALDRLDALGYSVVPPRPGARSEVPIPTPETPAEVAPAAAATEIAPVEAAPAAATPVAERPLGSRWFDRWYDRKTPETIDEAIYNLIDPTVPVGELVMTPNVEGLWSRPKNFTRQVMADLKNNPDNLAAPAFERFKAAREEFLRPGSDQVAAVDEMRQALREIDSEGLKVRGPKEEAPSAATNETPPEVGGVPVSRQPYFDPARDLPGGTPHPGSAVGVPLWHVTTNRGQLLREGWNPAKGAEGLGRGAGGVEPGQMYTTADPRSVEGMVSTMRELRAEWEQRGQPSRDVLFSQLERERPDLMQRVGEYAVFGDPAKWTDIGVVPVSVDVQPHETVSNVDVGYGRATRQPWQVEQDIRQTYPTRGIQGVVSIPSEMFGRGQARIGEVSDQGPLPPRNVDLGDVAAGGGGDFGLLPRNAGLDFARTVKDWLTTGREPSQAKRTNNTAAKGFGQVDDSIAQRFGTLMPRFLEGAQFAQQARAQAELTRDLLINNTVGSGLTPTSSAAELLRALKDTAVNQQLVNSGVMSARDIVTARRQLEGWRNVSGNGDLLTSPLSQLASGHALALGQQERYTAAGKTFDRNAFQRNVAFAGDVMKAGYLLSARYHVNNLLDASVKNAMEGYGLPAEYAGTGKIVGKLGEYEMTHLPPEVAQGLSAFFSDNSDRLYRIWGAGGLFRLNRSIGEAVEESARSAVFFGAKDGYVRDALAPFLTNLTAVASREGADAAAIQTALSARQGRFGPQFLWETLRGAGLSEGASNAALRQWARVLERSNQTGIGEANRIHFDYSDRTNLDELMAKVLPFHVWASRNLVYYRDFLASHPSLAAALIAYDQEAEKERNLAGRTSRLRGMVGGGPGEIVRALFGQDGGLYLDPSQALFSIKGQFRDVPTSDESTPVGRVLDTAGRIGLSPWVGYTLPLQVAGLLGDRPVGQQFPVSRLLDRTVGINPEAPVQMGLNALQRLATGRTVRSISGDPVQDDAVRKQILDLAVRETGKPAAQAPEYMAALDDPGNPIYQQALAMVKRRTAGEGLLGFVAPIPMKFQTAEEAAVRQAQADARGGVAPAGEPGSPLVQGAPPAPSNDPLVRAYSGRGDSPEKLRITQQLANYNSLGTPEQQAIYQLVAPELHQLTDPAQRERYMQALGERRAPLEALLASRQQFLQAPENRAVAEYKSWLGRQFRANPEAAPADEGGWVDQYLKGLGIPSEARQVVPVGTPLPLPADEDPVLLGRAIQEQVGRISGNRSAAAAMSPRNRLGAAYLTWQTQNRGGSVEEFVNTILSNPEWRRTLLQSGPLPDPTPALAR